VEYYLTCHPGAREKHGIRKTRDRCYRINGREVKLDWEYDDPSGGPGFLVVLDGPLRQAFKDYVTGNSFSAEYNQSGIRNTNLHEVATDAKITFQDNTKYNRLEAMKVAKEQAHFREKAAACVNNGQTVPSDLMDNYKEVMEDKLGKSRLEYEQAKKRWSAKAQADGTSMYPKDAPPGMAESQLITEGWKEEHGPALQNCRKQMGLAR